MKQSGYRVIFFISLAYLLLSVLLVGFRPEQLVLVTLFTGMYCISGASRRFITGFSVFIVYWIIFDYMKAFPNYTFGEVHIESLYNAEKQAFGWMHNGTRLTPNEYWLQHTNIYLDILTGFFYLCWVPVPLLFAGYLFYNNKEQFLRFALSFFLVNIIGFIGYYLYPAAAPWYVQEYGFSFHPFTPGNTAGLRRFDDFFGVSIFHSLYTKSSNVFAAMPSLHSAYPVLVLYYGIRSRSGWINFLFLIIMLGIWFSAVYTSHHYVLDVLAGILCAVIGILSFQWLLRNNRGVSQFFNGFLKKIT